MKKGYFILLLLCAPYFASGQTYGNEWINYSQKYYKIKVAKNGIYRIDSLTLARAGISLSGLNPKNFQLFYKGAEQYIYVKGENSGVFNHTDYIEFYGQYNDGTLDSLVYTGINFVPNPYYSMFNDTSTYFLTWNSSVNNRRMLVQTDTSFSSYTPANYFIAETVSYGSSQFYGGARIPVPPLTVSDPHYTSAEGWFNNELDLNQTQTYNLNVSNVYPSGPAAIFSTVVAGESNAGFSPDHEIQISSSWAGPGPMTDTIFGNTFPVFRETYSVAPSNLSGTVSMTFKSIGNNIAVNHPEIYNTGNTTAIPYIYGQYPHTMNMGGASSFMLYVPNNTSGSKAYLALTNFSFSAGDTVRFYDFTNHYRIKVVQAGSTVKALVPNSAGNIKQCYVTSDNQINTVTKVIPVGLPENAPGTFTDYTPANRTAPYIIITNSALWPAASAYATYRSRKYDVVLADVQQLYDQFGYGVDKDPLAIKRFCRYAVNTWRVPPAFLFLIGKGIHTPLYRQDTNNYKACLVPSFGYPSSDVLLTAGFANSSSLTPAIPTGRLAAIDEEEVYNYLTKAEIYEASPHAQWMKRVIHFCGGSNSSEQSTFLSYLGSYASRIESPYFGGFVYTFKKTTAQPIQITLADSITQLINNGVSIMTFFGHASGDNFDESLDVPSDYNNVDKYPLIIANACFSGDIFQPIGEAQSSTSEEFVLDPKGAIGFLASDDVGVADQLFNYTDNLYNNIAKLMYRKPLGDCIQATIAAQNSSDVLQRYTCMEMTLHGDPAISINYGDSLPDYAVSDSSIYFTPANVTTQIDSFKVHVVVSNLGEALNQPVGVSLTRIYPNGTTDSVYLKTVNHIYYQDTVVFTLPVDKSRGAGLNHFEVSVDPSNLLQEITKVNNNIGAPGTLLWITSGDIIPVFPYQFAIIPSDTVTLKASTGNPDAPLRKYIFQIDTTDYFNSPWLKSQIITAKGGVVCAPSQYWTNTPPPVGPTHSSFNGNNNMLRITGGQTRTLSSPLTFSDSTVYYWRVKRDTAANAPNVYWEESSFQYIKGKTGWAQAHYFQFKNNQYNYIDLNMPQRGWLFSPTGKTLECFTYGVPPSLSVSQLANYATQLWGTEYKLDFTLQAYAGCQYAPAVYVAVINPLTLEPWSTGTFSFGNINNASSGWCGVYPDKKFIFWDSSFAQQHGLENMLNAVPNGYYILAYTWMEGNFSHWAYPNLKNDFISLGADSAIHTYPDTVPWIFFVQKGNPTSVRQLVGTNAFDSLHLTTTLTNNEDFGSMISPLIGPAQKWDSISWSQHPLTAAARDSVRLSIMGVNQYGATTTLMSDITPAMANMYISSISTKLYPYLQLMMDTKDTVTHTPAQMRKWQVFFTPVPEVAVNPSLYTFFHKDSLTDGDSLYYKTVVQNISSYPIDSMQYNAWVLDAGNAIHYLKIKPYMTKKLNPGDTTLLRVKIPTVGYNNNNSLWIEVNPQYQALTRPEQYHFNNIARQSFYVAGDKINPLLDVTFDGIHIMNNDIVSAKPDIVMQLTDENKYLALDSSDFAVFVRNVNSPTAQRIYFGPQMTCTPAALPKNVCKINYTPVFQDGTYEITVQSKDRSGNMTASNDYKIDFQVINTPMISNVLNYPNPFSTSTRFVFTLTGSEVPTHFTIQIMTITGHVVREITEDELGPLHIGRNITQYAWDGRDQFGDKLANGIYLYRILTELNGQQLEHYSTGADPYFVKGWGKMYLIR